MAKSIMKQLSLPGLVKTQQLYTRIGYGEQLFSLLGGIAKRLATLILCLFRVGGSFSDSQYLLGYDSGRIGMS